MLQTRAGGETSPKPWRRRAIAEEPFSGGRPLTDVDPVARRRSVGATELTAQIRFDVAAVDGGQQIRCGGEMLLPEHRELAQ
jgi:hypothetical protein